MTSPRDRLLYEREHAQGWRAAKAGTPPNGYESDWVREGRAAFAHALAQGRDVRHESRVGHYRKGEG